MMSMVSPGSSVRQRLGDGPLLGFAVQGGVAARVGSGKIGYSPNSISGISNSITIASIAPLMYPLFPTAGGTFAPEMLVETITVSGVPSGTTLTDTFENKTGTLSGSTITLQETLNDSNLQASLNAMILIFGGGTVPASVSVTINLNDSANGAYGFLGLPNETASVYPAVLNATGSEVTTLIPGLGIHAPSPTITGTTSSQPTVSEAPVSPFSGVTIGDVNIGGTETLTISLAGTGGTLSGAGTASGGVYTLTGSASAVTTALDAVVFTATAGAANSSSTTTFTLRDTSSAYGTPTTDSTTTVVDSDPAAALPGEVVLHGSSDQYIIANDGGSLYIQDTVAGRDGTQVLPGVNEMLFTNGTGVFDPTGAAEDVARLYQTVLDRAPDVAGLLAWTAQIDDSNVPLSAVASAFASSPEFIQDNGSLSDTAFVNQLYENVLGRPADAAGAADWNSLLASGTSRGAVAVDIAKSPESQADALSTEGDNNNGEVYRLYETALGRAPDLAGQTGWSSLMADGASVTQIAQDFVNSAEFQKNFGTLSASDFVTSLYQNALHRAPDAAGLQAWTNALQQGASEASVIVGFSDSTESRAFTAGATHANWVFIAAPA